MERRSGRREGLEVVHSSRSSPRREGLATAVRKGRCASREPSSPPEESSQSARDGGGSPALGSVKAPQGEMEAGRGDHCPRPRRFIVTLSFFCVFLCRM